MQHKYDHSDFINSLTFEEYCATLTGIERQAIKDFHTTYPASSPFNPSPTITSHYKTTNDIFVALQHDRGADMRPSDPATHLVATCRRIGQRILQETCTVQAIHFEPAPGTGQSSMEKILHLKGMETSRLAVVKLGHHAVWIEQDHEGYAAHYPLLPFNPRTDLT